METYLKCSGHQILHSLPSGSTTKGSTEAVGCCSTMYSPATFAWMTLVGSPDQQLRLLGPRRHLHQDPFRLGRQKLLVPHRMELAAAANTSIPTSYESSS